MIRHAVAVALVLCVSPSWLSAQGNDLTVKLASANVHKGPSTGSPVIGKAPRGTVLEVTRELGDWVKVTWTAAPDGAGYVHLTSGSLAPRGATVSNRSAAAATPASSSRTTTARVTPESRPARPSLAETDTMAAHQHMTTATQPGYVTPPAHMVGLGGRVNGSTLGFGGSARAWTQKRLGLQLEVSRYGLTSPVVPGRVTTVQIAPSLLYSLPDRVTDYFWLRPYVGAGVNLARSSQSGLDSTNKTGVQAFGGAEVTFASLPRFALSADLGYRRSPAPFVGFDFGGVGFSVAGHWYVR